MEKSFCVIAIILLASCMSVNTKDSLIATGKKSEVFHADFPVDVLANRIQKYLNHCYRSSKVITNGTELGGALDVSRAGGAKHVELTVRAYLAKGTSSLLHVVITADDQNIGSNVVSYAADMTRAGAFEKIEQISREDEASCPYSLTKFSL